MVLSAFIISSFLFSATSVHAESSEIFTLEDVKNSQIEVNCSGVNADVLITEDNSGPSKLKSNVFQNSKPISSSNWRVSVTRDTIQNVYKITCNYPESAQTDKKLLSEYLFSINLKGPASRELSIHVRNGKTEIVNWSQATQIVMEDGSASLKNTSGSFNVNVLRGSIDVQKHNGRLRADMFQGKLVLNQVDGNLDVTNFNGNSQLKTINGDISFNSRNGTLNLDSSQGSFKFDSDLGKIDIKNFNGSINGKSDQASIFAKLMNPAKFRAKIKNAIVRLSVPSDSGAQVYLALNEGQFQVPNYLSQDNYGPVKTTKGTLRGGETGRISVTGDSGKVSLSTF